MPRISRNGRTLTFKVRKSMKFSNGKALTAANYAAAIDRVADPKFGSPAVAFASDIVGFDAVNAGRGSHVSGVTTKGNTITIRLTAAHVDFLSRLAMMFFCPVPKGTPRPAAGTIVPGSGPYYVSSRTPGRTIVLKRNKNYKGPRPHNANEMDVTVNTNQDTSLLQVQRGSADYDLGGHPGTADAGLSQKYGLNKKQYFVSPQISTNYFAMNNSRGVFKGVAARKAVNYAIDRTSLIKTQGKFAGKPTDQLLPPKLAGYRPANLFPNRPNVSKAKRLLAGKKPTVDWYEGGSDIRKARAAAAQAQLKRVGIDVKIHGFGTGVMYKKCGTRGEAFDICDVGWVADYVDPFDFVDVLLNGNNIQASNNNNYAYFNNAKYNRRMNAANKLSGPKRYKAYGNLDVDISKNAAPNAYWINFNNRDFISSKTGCYTFQPVYASPDFTILCRK